MCKGWDGALTKSVNLIFHYTSKEHIFNLCSVFIDAFFFGTLVSCLYSFYKCLERYQSCEGFVLRIFVHLDVSCVYTFCHTGRKDSITNFVSILSVSMSLDKKEGKWKYLTGISS